MLALSNIALSTFEDGNQALKDLYTIFSETLNQHLSYEEFCLYYFRHKPHYMDISFIKNNEQTIGFTCVTFYRQQLGNKTYTICRGATGIKEAYRGGNLPSWNLCQKYITYKLKHPLEKMYVIAYVANPLMYSMICKHAGKVYPKGGVAIPQHILNLRENLLASNGFRERETDPFTLKIHFQVQMTARDTERIFASEDRDVKYYLDLNPHFREQVCIMTIIPLTWYNISICLIKSLAVKPVKNYIRRNIEARKKYSLAVNNA